MPSISVLMPVRNAAPWLAASLASLWRQTHADFEVVAVDDGSTDASAALLDRAAAREPRLRVLHTPHRGLPAALNTALEAARGPLIARHDADDLSHRARLEHQRAWLDRHREVSVVGCRIRLFPAPGAGMRRWAAWHNRLIDHEAMAREALIDSPLAHGTALIRRPALESVGGWREKGWPEDLDLWLRLLEAGHRFGKVPMTLYGWRQHPGSATRRDPRYGRERFMALRYAALTHGLLRRAPRVTIVGVGRSLDAWRQLLSAQIDVRLVGIGRPMAALVATLTPPMVLVFGAEPARKRWREGLNANGFVEGIDFAFVA